MPAIRLLFGSCLALAAFALVAAAEEGCQCENGFYEKIVPGFKKVCKDVPTPTVVKKCFIRYENQPVKTTVLVPKEFCVKVPKEVPVEQIVTKCRKVPVKLVDPDTGCAILTYKNEFYPAKVVTTKTVMVDAKVIKKVPMETTVMQPMPVKEYRDVTIMVPRQVCEMVPCQTKVRLPCPPAGPNYRVEVPVRRLPVD